MHESYAGAPEAPGTRPGDPSGCHVQLFAADATAPVRWRLLSGNNRDLGRGAATHPDAETCMLAVKQVQSALALLTPRVRRLPTGGWGWELCDDAGPVAANGRPFDRLIRCEQGLTQFVTRLADAPVRGPVMLSASRRWTKAV